MLIAGAALTLTVLVAWYYRRSHKPLHTPHRDQPGTKTICFSTIDADGNETRLLRVVKADTDIPTMSKAYAQHLKNQCPPEVSRQNDNEDKI